MLVLTRRPGESIQIGPDCQVVVLGSKGNRVRIGIKAPVAIKVLRDELHAQRIQPSSTSQGSRM